MSRRDTRHAPLRHCSVAEHCFDSKNHKTPLHFVKTAKHIIMFTSNRPHARLYAPLFLFALLQACAKPMPFSEPDREKFLRAVASPALRDSLQHSTFAVGMPYFVAAEICKNQKGVRRVAVASPGSRQPLRETEGFGRRYVDPTIQIFLDEYETTRGRLRIWYQRPDFYRLHVASGDTLVVFWQEQSPRALVQFLHHENSLFLTQGMNMLPAETKLDGEIRHVNAPDARSTSHWYNLKLWQDRQTLVLTSLSHESYPIVWMELEGETITSFAWK